MSQIDAQSRDLPPLCWVNGLRIDPQAPAISVLDRGFTLADGCFETMRAYSGTVFRLDAHLARLATTLARLGMAVPPHLDAAISDAVRTLSAARVDRSVRLTVTRGRGSGVAPPGAVEPTTVLLVDRLGPSTSVRHGLRVCVADGRRNEYAPTAGLKTLSYTDAVVALSAARAQGADDAILLDTGGHLSEGSSSNIFAVIRGIARTPPVRCGALPGITRAAVLEILARLAIPIDESPIPAGALTEADEVFLTSSLREVAPVIAVDNRPVGTGHVGPLTVRVQEAYRQLIADEVADRLALA
jgi:branched-subunit amino acid aminotransferase/4-amino-4-deoxychorismate lyase